jgi:sulfite reductase alpha subunit-like flavoprotein
VLQLPGRYSSFLSPCFHASNNWGSMLSTKSIDTCCSFYMRHPSPSADVKPGDKLVMTGPSGTALLLKEDAWDRPIVCVATGTGIAPFRSFWRRLVYDGVPAVHGDGASGKLRGFGERGRFWLLAGFANEVSVLYGEELAAAVEAEPGRVRVDMALSLQQKNAAGGPLYVQDRIKENSEDFHEFMASDDAVFHFCGLKRMYSSVMEVRVWWGKEVPQVCMLGVCLHKELQGVFCDSASERMGDQAS